MKLPAFILTFQEHVVEAVPLLKQERDDLCTCIYACMFLWLHNFFFFKKKKSQTNHNIGQGDSLLSKTGTLLPLEILLSKVWGWV